MTITFDRFIRWMLGALLAAAIIYMVNYLSNVLLPFFIAWLLAYLLYPTVRFVQYRMHVPGRVLSIIVTLVFVTVVIGCIVWMIIPPMIEQFERLGYLLGRYLHDTIPLKHLPRRNTVVAERKRRDYNEPFPKRGHHGGCKGDNAKGICRDRKDGKHYNEYHRIADYIIVYVLHT